MSIKENFSDIVVYVIFGLMFLALSVVVWKIMGGFECSTIPKRKSSVIKENPITAHSEVVV